MRRSRGGRAAAASSRARAARSKAARAGCHDTPAPSHASCNIRHTTRRRARSAQPVAARAPPHASRARRRRPAAHGHIRLARREHRRSRTRTHCLWTQRAGKAGCGRARALANATISLAWRSTAVTSPRPAQRTRPRVPAETKALEREIKLSCKGALGTHQPLTQAGHARNAEGAAGSAHARATGSGVRGAV